MIGAYLKSPTRRSILHLPAAAGALFVGSRFGYASTYPSMPVHFYVPFTPGGGADALARIVGQYVSADLRQPMVIENKPGAGGNIAAELVAKARPDGYTLLEANLAHSIAMTLYRRLRYDIKRDFESVIGLGSVPFVLATSAELPVKSVRDLIDLARSKPGALNYASSGLGGPSHLAMVMFENLAKVQLTHVPYKGAAPAAEDLMAGRVQVSFLTIPAAASLMKARQIKGLAVSTKRRSSILPNLPTIAESSVAAYDASTWFGVMAPRGTAENEVLTLNKAFGRALQDQTARKQLQGQGFEIMGGSPEEFSAFVDNETEKWGAVVKSAGIAID